MERWTWECEPPVADVAGPFPSQAEAEAWLGENWEQLAQRGVEAVTLKSGDFTVYGPMPLAAG